MYVRPLADAIQRLTRRSALVALTGLAACAASPFESNVAAPAPAAAESAEARLAALGLVNIAALKSDGPVWQGEATRGHQRVRFIYDTRTEELRTWEIEPLTPM